MTGRVFSDAQQRKEAMWHRFGSLDFYDPPSHRFKFRKGKTQHRPSFRSGEITKINHSNFKYFYTEK